MPTWPNLAQRERDRLQLEELQADDFSGRRWDLFIEDLWKYLWPTVLSALAKGSINTVRVGPGHPMLTFDDVKILHESSAEREDLAVDCIYSALDGLSAELRTGTCRWRASGGRTFRSYAYTRCVIEFWRKYPEWRRRRDELLRQVVLDADLELLTEDRAGWTPLAAEQRSAVELLLRRAESRPELTAILRAIDSGVKPAKIAESLGYSSTRAVEGRLYRFRNEAWKLVKTGEIHPRVVPGSRANRALRQPEVADQ